MNGRDGRMMAVAAVSVDDSAVVFDGDAVGNAAVAECLLMFYWPRWP